MFPWSHQCPQPNGISTGSVVSVGLTAVPQFPTYRPTQTDHATFVAIGHIFALSACTHPFNTLFPGQPRWAGTGKVKPIWTLLKQETVSGSGVSWAVCKSASRSRQTTVPAPHHSFFYRLDALPVAQPTASKHWRQQCSLKIYHNSLRCSNKS